MENMQRPRALSPSSRARLVIKNRRIRFLDLTPQYLDDASLELADPLAYDRLVRRFQSAAEREEEGRKKGYTGVLEADLWRGEAKVEALKNPDEAAQYRYKRDEKGEIVAEERDEVPTSKEEGLQRWRKEMELRFLRGEDSDFQYQDVDGNEEYDDLTALAREEQDQWFEMEEPSVVDDVKQDELQGQTGVQDF